jgi:hypothetical protein
VSFIGVKVKDKSTFTGPGATLTRPGSDRSFKVLPLKTKQSLNAWLNGHSWDEHDRERPHVVGLFVSFHQAGERPHDDDLRAWATQRGWGPDDVNRICEMSEIVQLVLRETGHIKSS